jgi:hypothetical protein
MDGWPVVVAAHDVVKHGANLVAFLLECTRCVCVAVAGGMVAGGPTVATCASQLSPWFLSTATATATTVASTIVLFVDRCFCEHGNSIAQQLQLHCHVVSLLLRTVMNVGGNLILLFVLDNHCYCNRGNVVPEFAAFVGFRDLIWHFCTYFSLPCCGCSACRF